MRAVEAAPNLGSLHPQQSVTSIDREDSAWCLVLPQGVG